MKYSELIKDCKLFVSQLSNEKLNEILELILTNQIDSFSSKQKIISLIDLMFLKFQLF